MVAAANMVEVAALVGDTARATMLAALMGGQSLTASELAFLARVSRPTASEHLRKLTTRVCSPSHRSGATVIIGSRRRWSQRCSRAIHAVAAIEVPPRYQPRSAKDDALRFARTCYDHLAGRLGVAIADAMVNAGYLTLGDDGGEVTEAGHAFLATFGVDLTADAQSRRIYCRPCLDWSERRYHVAGHIGRGILHRCLDLGWLAWSRDTRAVTITPIGREGLRKTFGIELASSEPLKIPAE